MFDAVSASTASAPGCAPAPAELSSSAAASRAAIASRPSTGRPYRSLRSSAEFSRAYKNGTRRRCGAVTVVTAAGPAGPPTVGFIAGKKVGSAVLRNRAKRRMREAAARCELKSDTVYVLIADRAVLTAPFASLIGSINRCIGEQSVAEERA